MATELRLRRGTTAEHATFTGALAEVTVDTTTKGLVVHDGITPGGFPVGDTIDPGTTEQYLRGDKTWRDFFTDVRAATLTGLSTATNAVVGATDTVLAAIGKLQAQVSAKFDKTGGDISGNINITGNVGLGTSNPGAKLEVLGGVRIGNGVSTSYLRLVHDTANGFLDTNVGALILQTQQTNRLLIDTTGNVLVMGGALGYGVGAGGTVVQATSKSTAVTLNKPSGYITTSSSALAGGATVVFRFNNSNISADGSDVMLFTVAGYDADRYTVDASVFAPGVCSVSVKNNTEASLSEAVPINFAVIKAVRS